MLLVYITVWYEDFVITSNLVLLEYHLIVSVWISCGFWKRETKIRALKVC